MFPKLDKLTSKYIAVVGIVVLVAVLVILASKMNQWRKGSLPAPQLKKLRTVIKQSAHYASLAEQDDNPVYSLMHANTALNYFALVEALTSASDIKRLSGVDASEMTQYLLWQQEKALGQLSRTCPTGQPKDAMYKVSVSK